MKRTDPSHPALALVTGADGGIGRAFCRQLASQGTHLVLAGISAEGLERLRAELEEEWPGVQAYTAVCDLTTREGIELLEDYRTPDGERPDMLVNNAGIFSFMPVTELGEGKTDAFIRLHIDAVTRLSRSYGRRFAASRRGWILNMSSMSCWMPVPGLAMYAATKAYIRVFTRSLAYELEPQGVKVMVACPGGIATPLFGLPPKLMKLALGLGAIARPETFARQALKRLFKGKHQFINGLSNRLAIPAVGMMPKKVRMLVKTRMLDKGIVR